MMAAVLACGDGTVVSHVSAAALLDLHDRAPAAVDVIAPGQGGRTIAGIRSHNVRRPRENEVVGRAGIPCTTPARTLVDLAGVLGERSLRATVERAAVQGTLDLRAIEEVIAGGKRRGAPRLREILCGWSAIRTEGERVGGRLRSELEARLLALIGAAGLPIPISNQVIQVEGSCVEVDLLWPAQRLIVETDGRRYHDHQVAFERDRRRDRLLQLAGYRVIRVTAAQIEGEPAGVLGAIRRFLATR
jgi:hypothetical protein